MLIKYRNDYRNLYVRTRDPAFKSAINQLNKLIRNQVRSEKFQAFETKLGSLSYVDNSLFLFAKGLKRKRKSIPPIKDTLGYHYSDSEKAEAFARSFKSHFLSSSNSTSRFERIVSNSVQSLLSINDFETPIIPFDEVKFIFSSLNHKKSCGADCIPNMALRHLSSCYNFTTACTDIFNCCLKISYFPDTWKVAKILPIPKTAIPSKETDKYRPISLLSCLGKCFEKIILSRLSDFELDNNIFINQQCGFRSEHSTIHQSLRIIENVAFGFNKNKSTAMVLLDLRKAFDSVWHDGLIHKMRQKDYPLYLIKLIHSFLKNRVAFTAINSYQSVPFDVPCGVPQGSLIAPHLFNLFINDIPLPNKGNLSLYADDTAFFVQVPWKNLKSAKKILLATLNHLNNFFIDWKIHLNDSKTEFIMFSKSTKMIKMTSNDTLSFNNLTFKWKPTVKYLGLTLDSKLLFKNHVEVAINKAQGISYSSLYCLLNRKSPVSIDTKLRIYKIYIRPVFTYGCQVFANAAKCHLEKLQKFQNKILRMILNLKWSDFKSTQEIHDSTKIPLVSEFITRLTNKFYSKIVHHSNPILSSLGHYHIDSLGFRVKHKLPRAID